KLTTDVSTRGDWLPSITIQPDGKLLAAGMVRMSSTDDFGIVRYNANGTLDTTFGVGGKVTTNVGGSWDQGYGISVQPDGKIVVGGHSHNGLNYDFSLVRYNPDGSLDTRFDLVNTLGGTVSYTAETGPVVLDSNVRVFDTEISNGNFSNATLTLARNGGANPQDLFSATGTLGSLTQGSNLVVGGTTIGNVTTNILGTLVLTFNSNATNSLVNSAMQQIAYANYSMSGTVQINWTFSDGNSGIQGTGGALAATGNVTVNVTNVNNAPTAVADTTIAIEAGGINNTTAGVNPVGNVLANDTDTDTGDSKTVTGVAAGVVGSASSNVGSSVIGTFGTITIANDGTYTYTIDNSNAIVQALRSASNTLTDVFTYTMCDTAGLTSTTQVTVTIQGVNDAPHDLSGVLSIAENAMNGSIAGTIIRSDVDAGDGATYSLVDNAGGRFAINGSTGVVTVANSTLLNYEAATSHNITVRVTDTAGATFDKVINVTLTDVNEFNVGTITDLDWNDNGVPENSVGGTTVGIIARASDPDGTQNAVTYSLLDSADGRFEIDPVTGVVTVAENSVLDYESITSHSIVVVANSSDGSESTATFSISVLPVNERPIAFSEQYQTDFVTPITISAAELLFNDFDEDGDTLQIVLLAPPDRGTLTMIPGGGFTYRPEVNFVGIATIQYAVFDGQFLSDPQTIELTITPPGNTVVSPPDRPDPPGVTNELPSVDDDQRITDPIDLVTVSPEPTPSPAPPPALNPVPVPIVDHPQSQTDEASPPKELLPEPLGVVRNDEQAIGRTDSLQLVEAIDLIHSGLATRSMQGVGPSIQRLELETLQGDVLQLENQNVQLFVSQDQRQVLENLKQENFVRTSTPIVVGTAIGAGISIHVLTSAHFGSTLLSQSGVFMPLDPLTVLEGTAKVKKSKAREDLLFEGVAINDHASK
ncbi:MAG: tandem-95 repeat protein, partial [Planctomycetes bacterium]|nr:tandem-95 repeat protein [Planctomycetota bacterium]